MITTARRFLEIVRMESPRREDITEAIAIQNEMTVNEPRGLADCRAAIAVLSFDLDKWVTRHGLTAAVRGAV